MICSVHIPPPVHSWGSGVRGTILVLGKLIPSQQKTKHTNRFGCNEPTNLSTVKAGLRKKESVGNRGGRKRHTHQPIEKGSTKTNCQELKSLDSQVQRDVFGSYALTAIIFTQV